MKFKTAIFVFRLALRQHLRLTAAAPEMFDALDALVTQIERSKAIDDNGHELRNLKALHDARALLARIIDGNYYNARYL